jgi:thiol-disulfide isomerase/thioredoxin
MWRLWSLAGGVLSSALIAAGCAPPPPLHEPAESPSRGGGSVTIRGVIRCADGTAPKLAHAALRWSVYEDPEARTLVQAGADGSFELEAPTGEAVFLMFSAVDHRPFGQLWTFFDEGEGNADLDARLAPIVASRDLATVSIVRGTAEPGPGPPPMGEPMERQPDGTFVWEGQIDGPSFSYQVALPMGPRSMWCNGTMADRFQRTGNGSYRSILDVAPGRLRVVFDPSVVVQDGGAAWPRFEWEENHSHLTEMHELDLAITAARQRIAAARHASMRAGRALDGLEPELGAIEELIRARLAEDRHPLVRAWAAMNLVEHHSAFSRPLEVSDPDLILELAPPDQPLWAARPQLLGRLALLLGDRADEVMQRFERESPARLVRAEALMSRAFPGEGHDPKAVRHDLVARLRQDYGDLGWVIDGLERTLQVYGLAAREQVAPGMVIPDVTVVLVDGARVATSSLGGRYTLLNFWATWCAPCLDEMPELHEAQERFGGRGLDIISLSVDQDPAAVERWRAGRWHMPWRHAMATGDNAAVLAAFKVASFPTNILVGPDGTVVATGSATVGDRLLRTLKEHIVR